MRWYLNDASVQGQFKDTMAFEAVLRELNAARYRIEPLRRDLRTSLAFSDRNVSPGITVRQAVCQSRNGDFRKAILEWLGRSGPFVEGDQLVESDNYFEYSGLEITESGLGEAARRVKSGEEVTAFSFRGGNLRFEVSPLSVDHGLREDRLGSYCVENVWTVDDLIASALAAGPPITSWRSLVEDARSRFPQLLIPDTVFLNPRLAREPFNTSIKDRAIALLEHLDHYMQAHAPDGTEGPEARAIIENFFTGDRALFSAESPSNQREFRSELTFADPLDTRRSIFGHWHGKISHRYFRLHFEWPVPVGSSRIKILYLGPKLTKD